MKTLYYNNPGHPEVQQISVVAAFLNSEINHETVKRIDGVHLKVNGKYLKGANTIVKFLAHGQKIGGES